MDQVLTEKSQIETEIDKLESDLYDIEEKITDHLTDLSALQIRKNSLKEDIRFLEAEKQLFLFILEKESRTKIKNIIEALDKQHENSKSKPIPIPKSKDDITPIDVGSHDLCNCNECCDSRFDLFDESNGVEV